MIGPIFLPLLFMTSSLSRYSDWGLLVLRLAVAAAFLVHGTQKFGLWNTAPEGFPAAMLVIMRVLSIVEPLAGLAILLGIFLRPAALVLAVIMIGAIVMKIALLKLPYAASDSVGWELDAILLGAALVLATVGGGKLVVKKG